MGAADQAGFIGIVVNGHEIDLDLIGLENSRGAANHEFADPAGAKAAADCKPLDIPPSLQFEKAANDQRQVLRKLLDGGLNHARSLDVIAGKQRIELFFVNSSLGASPRGSPPA